MKAGVVVVGVVAVAVLSGCGSGGDDAAEAGSSSSSSVAGTGAASTTTATVVRLSVADAGPRYLEIVGPYNEALEALESAVNGGQSVDAVRPLVTALVAANATQIEQLQSVAWPEAVESAMAALVSESELAQEAWLRAEQAPTLEAMVQEIVAAGEHDGSEPAATIREQLGLDAYDENDYTP